jgi:hypothetical protein
MFGGVASPASGHHKRHESELVLNCSSGNMEQGRVPCTAHTLHSGRVLAITAQSLLWHLQPSVCPVQNGNESFVCSVQVLAPAAPALRPVHTTSTCLLRNMPGERSTHEAPAVTSLSLNVISPYHRARRWCAWFTLSTSLPMYDCSALSRETSVSTRRTCPALDTGQNQVPISVTGMRPTPGTTLSMILVSFGSVCLSLLSIVQLVCGAIRPSTYRYHRRCPRG